MASAPEEFSNLQIIDNSENKQSKQINSFLKNIVNIENDDSVSLNTTLTSAQTNSSNYKSSRKVKVPSLINSKSSAFLNSNKKSLYIENEFFAEKELSAHDLLFSLNNSTETKNYKKEKLKETVNNNNSNEKEKISENVQIVNNCVNKKDKGKTYKEININESKKDKNNKEQKEEKDKVKNNKIKNSNVIVNNKDGYSQTYTRNDFKDKPPKVSQLFNHYYEYEIKNTFSNANETLGEIKENEKVPNCFYNHIMINNNRNTKHIEASLNKRNCGKLLSIIYYSP